MSLEDDIEAERAAVSRMVAAIDIIVSDAAITWRFGDGFGGFILEELAAAAAKKGYSLGEPKTPTAPRKARISRSLSRQVMERDKYRCVTCATHLDLTCDHIVPESKGGLTEFGNLQTMCRSCNSKKGTKCESVV